MSAPKRIPKVLSPEEQAALLRTFNRRWPTKLRNYALVLTMLRTGLRAGEAVASQSADSIIAPSQIRGRYLSTAPSLLGQPRSAPGLMSER